MKILTSWFLALSLCFLHYSVMSQSHERVVVDEILAIIYSPQGNQLVTLTNLRPRLDSSPRSLKQAIIESLMLLDAQKLMIVITDADIERFLLQLQKEQGYSKAALMSFFKESGYTYEEGIEQIKQKHTLEAVIDYRIRGDKNMIVTRQAVEEHYNAHPLYTEEEYILAQTFIPASSMSTSEVQRLIDTGAINTAVAWEQFSCKENELAEEKQKLIIDKKAGSIIEFEEVEDGIELTRLVEKKEADIIPLDTVYDTIVQNLKSERFIQLLNDYQNKLLSQANIRFTYPEDKKLVMPTLPE